MTHKDVPYNLDFKSISSALSNSAKYINLRCGRCVLAAGFVKPTDNQHFTPPHLSKSTTKAKQEFAHTTALTLKPANKLSFFNNYFWMHIAAPERDWCGERCKINNSIMELGTTLLIYRFQNLIHLNKTYIKHG